MRYNDLSRKDVINLLRDITSVECPILNRRASVMVIMFDSRSADFLCNGLKAMRYMHATTRNCIVRIPIDETGYTTRPV